MKKKTIIILIVAAVAVYLIWRRRSENAATGNISTGNTGATLDPSNLEDVIAAAKISSTLAAKVREKAAAAEAMESVKTTIQGKADEKGNTYAQQVLFEALYPVYHVKDGDSWVIKDATASATWKAIKDRVKNM